MAGGQTLNGQLTDYSEDSPVLARAHVDTTLDSTLKPQLVPVTGQIYFLINPN